MSEPSQIATLLRTIAERNRQLPPMAESERRSIEAAFVPRIVESSRDGGRPGLEAHMLVGPAGAGKTTCLCKWLARAVLRDNRSAVVWRLDGRGPNTAESLSVYADILKVPVHRSTTAPPAPGAQVGFLDLPGVDYRDSEAVRELGRTLDLFPGAVAHLVLNAAYEVPLLMAQTRAFSALPIADLIFAHGDEETRWSKLQAISLGTNFAIRFISAGQNVPGDLAEPQQDGRMPLRAPVIEDLSFQSKPGKLSRLA